MKENALVIFIKTPKAHFTKTRLIPFLSGDQAAEFYSMCIKDLYRNFNAAEYCDTWFAIDPVNFDAKKIPVDLESGLSFFQQGDDLGQRMYNAFLTVKKKSINEYH